MVQGHKKGSIIIATGLSRRLRLLARSKSYHIQLLTPSDSWLTVQLIPRTQVILNIDRELTIATRALARREIELAEWRKKLPYHSYEEVFYSILRHPWPGAWHGFKWASVVYRFSEKIKYNACAATYMELVQELLCGSMKQRR